MAGQDTRVEGADNLSRTMHRAGDDLADMSRANSEIAAYAASRAAIHAPRDTGRLAGSIRGEGTPDQAEIGSDLEYAGVQNYGWPGHNIRPTYFLNRALSDSSDKITAAYTAEADRVLSRVKGI